MRGEGHPRWHQHPRYFEEETRGWLLLYQQEEEGMCNKKMLVFNDSWYFFSLEVMIFISLPWSKAKVITLKGLGFEKILVNQIFPNKLNKTLIAILDSFSASNIIGNSRRSQWFVWTVVLLQFSHSLGGFCGGKVFHNFCFCSNTVLHVVHLTPVSCSTLRNWLLLINVRSLCHVSSLTDTRETNKKWF